MEESFKLPVSHKGEVIEVPVTLRVTGYSPRFIALIGTLEVTIEKDEEGAYRALHGNSDGPPIDKDLVSGIVEKLQLVFG